MIDPLSGGRIHIIGIGGIGMSAIAEIMQERGIPVQGSDQKEGANTRRIAAQGIKVLIGQDAANLEGASVVCISSAVKEGNPELRVARERGLPVFSRAETLAALMKDYRTICVTGSHGKTTTTSMIGWIMEKAGLDPTVLVGGVLRSWGTNARIGASRWMVVEADESDATFIRLPTEIGVATNIDPEHLDYYGSVEALHEAFRTFLRQIPQSGVAVAGIDHPVVRELTQDLAAAGELPPLASFGRALDARVKIDNVVSQGASVVFDVAIAGEPGEPPLRHAGVKLQVPGAHNALNAAAAIAACLHAGLTADQIFDGLASFEGVDRRFSPRGEWNGVAIYDDYAHHPAEIAAVLSAARGAAAGRVIAVVQPHRYSRLQSLFGEFCSCFADADTVVVTPVYSAGEQPNGIDRDTLVDGLRQQGHARVYPVDGEDTLVSTLATVAQPGDLVLTLGAGTISEWARALPEKLSHYPAFAGAAE